MSKVTSFCQSLLVAATEKYGPPPENESDSQLPELLNIGEILDIIVILVEHNANVETIETLDLLEEGDDQIQNEDLEDANVQDVESENMFSSESQQLSQEWEVLKIGRETFTLDFMQKVLQFYDSCASKKMHQTTRRYPRVTDRKQIQRFREYTEKHGTKYQKLESLENFVYEKFAQARQNFYCVTGNDLRRWGQQKACDIGLDFTASSGWLHIFKLKKRIVSRKITKMTTSKEINEQKDLEKVANEFVEQTKASFCKVPSKQIWNFDQSGFNYEHVCKRTLSDKGEKLTQAHIASKNATTHSYSIMPLIAMDGQVGPKMLLCLQEPKGVFGPVVKSKIKEPSNITLTCSKSGKLDKRLMKEWLDSCVAKLGSPKEKIELMFDSWTGQTDPGLYDGLQNVGNTHIIPPKITFLVQPLDKVFFRQYKIVRTKIFERNFLGGFGIALHDRDNVIKMHALIYNQFQSAKFKPMIQYAWYACGYVDVRPGYFLNATEILFESASAECSFEDCLYDFFIKCSHCDSLLCFEHFFVANHFHEI